MLKKILFLVLVICLFSKIALASFSMSIDYPKEIVTERDWIKYFNVVVTNNGDELHDVMISFNGEYTQWFEIETNKTDLQSNSNASFLVKLTAPNSIEPKAYSFTLNIKSKEASDSKTFTVRIFNSETDATLYQVQQLENEIEGIKRNTTIVEGSGKNVTGVENTLNEAQGYLNDSKNYIDQGDYQKVATLLINAEDLIKKAEYDLSIAPSNISIVSSSTSFPFELIPIPILIVLLIIVFYLGFIKKKKETPIVQPAAKIKEVILEGKDSNSLENGLKDIESSLNLLEEEFKENLLSKESYDELKAKYEKRISDMREEIDRNRKV